MSEISQLHIYSTRDELLEAANEQAQSTLPIYLESTKLYFIARYFVAIYESRYGEIPIQVWNEYRNALDHFFRHLTNINNRNTLDTNDEDNNLHKMECHLQRAALDILKLLCHKTNETVEQKKVEYSVPVMRLVDNGKFLIKINDDLNKAVKLFETAKVSDLKLGGDAASNAKVLEIYLNAAFAFDAIKLTLSEKNNDILSAQESYNSISSRASNLSLSAQLFIAFTILLIGLVAGPYATDYINNSKASADDPSTVDK